MPGLLSYSDTLSMTLKCISKHRNIYRNWREEDEQEPLTAALTRGITELALILQS